MCAGDRSGVSRVVSPVTSVMQPHGGQKLSAPWQTTALGGKEDEKVNENKPSSNRQQLTEFEQTTMLNEKDNHDIENFNRRQHY